MQIWLLMIIVLVKIKQMLYVCLCFCRIVSTQWIHPLDFSEELIRYSIQHFLSQCWQHRQHIDLLSYHVSIQYTLWQLLFLSTGKNIKVSILYMFKTNHSRFFLAFKCSENWWIVSIHIFRVTTPSLKKI